LQREALVLDTVRLLVRPTAGEIVQRTGLPNGSVHVALRALLAGGRVVRTATARGKEYSLVSAGSVKPFKRPQPAANGALLGGAVPGAAIADPSACAPVVGVQLSPEPEKAGATG
jgi:hypothetical protein